jgi:hypothetical protein
LTSDMSSGSWRPSFARFLCCFLLLPYYGKNRAEAQLRRVFPLLRTTSLKSVTPKPPSLPQCPLQPLLTKLWPPLVGNHTAQLLPLLLPSSSSCGHPPGHPPCQPTHMIKSVRDSHRGPLNNRENPTFFRKIQNTNELTTIKHTRNNHGPAAGDHGTGGPSSPPEQSAPATLERNSASLEGHNTALMKFCLARGAQHRTNETPPRSRFGRPLG